MRTASIFTSGSSIIIISLNLPTAGILGGYEIDIEEAPFQVNYGDICGGVLIHKRWAMTTAHCGKMEFIRVGSKRRLQGFQVKVINHIVHPLYQADHEFDFDIQLLQLKRNLQFQARVGAVVMCKGACGGEVRVAGWGYPAERGDYNELLQEVRLRIVPLDQCQRVQRSWYNHTLTDRMFCAGGGTQDACQGDSGSPAVSEGQLVGISSFGYGCGRRVPGVYINVTHGSLRPWIRSFTGV